MVRVLIESYWSRLVLKWVGLVTRSCTVYQDRLTNRQTDRLVRNAQIAQCFFLCPCLVAR